MSLRQTRILQDPQADRDAVDRMAAIVTSKASWLHRAPQPEATFAPDPVAEYRNQLRRQIAEKEADAARAKAAREQNKVKKTTKKPKPRFKCAWVRRHLKQLHRAKGLPPPTEAEIKAMKQAQSQYHKPL
jgi:hypothetical protein